MKYFSLLLLFLLLCLLSTACNDTPNSIDPPKEIPRQTIDAQPFDMEAISSQELQLAIYDNTYQSGQVYLIRNTDTLTTGSFSSDNSNLKTTLEHGFDDEAYSLAFELRKMGNDTLYTYQIKDFSYRFLNNVRTEAIASFSGHLGTYDLTPDEQFIYWSEHSQDNGDFSFTLHRLNRKTEKQELLDDDFDGWQLVRARSKDELITLSQKRDGRLLRQDSAALVSYNPQTKEKSFIEYVSDDYGRFSRIVDDRIMITRPYLSEPTAYVINFADSSRKGVNVDFRYIDEYERNILKVRNHRYVPERKTLEPINSLLTKTSTIKDFSNADNTAVVSQLFYVDRATLDFRVRLAVYRGQQKVFEEDAFQQKTISWAVYQANEQRVLFYQNFGPGTPPNRAGIYVLDLNTREITLIDNAKNTRQINRIMQTREGKLLGTDVDGIFEIHY